MHNSFRKLMLFSFFFFFFWIRSIIVNIWLLQGKILRIHPTTNSKKRILLHFARSLGQIQTRKLRVGGFRTTCYEFARNTRLTCSRPLIGEQGSVLIDVNRPFVVSLWGRIPGASPEVINFILVTNWAFSE
jgi:hypothetical protein